MFSMAIKELNNTDSVRVFAPTGLWSLSDDKERWIQALIDSPAKVKFAAGLTIEPTQVGVVMERLKKLQNNGVEVVVFPPQTEFKLGYIIFDNIALLGMETPRGFDFIKIKHEVEILKGWFDSVVFPQGKECRF